MFVTLDVLPQPPTFRRRFLQKKQKDVLSCSRVTLPNCFSFYHIQLRHDASLSMPWRKIAETAGAFSRRLLLPAGIAPRPDDQVCAFAPQKLPLRVLCNSSVRLLEAMGRDPHEQHLCVFDQQGVLADALEPFVPLVASLRVVTDDLAAYGETAAFFRRKYGLSLLLTPDEAADAPQCNLILADDAAGVPLTFTGVVLTNRPQTRMNAAVYTPEPVRLPPAYAALCPPGIDPLQFASAAYELCAADELGTLWAPMKALPFAAVK